MHLRMINKFLTFLIHTQQLALQPQIDRIFHREYKIIFSCIYIISNIGSKLSDLLHRNTYQICLATAHPAKFSQAVEKALDNFKEFKFENILPKEFIGLLEREKKVVFVEKAEPSLVKQVMENELDN